MYTTNGLQQNVSKLPITKTKSHPTLAQFYFNDPADLLKSNCWEPFLPTIYLKLSGHK